MEIISCVTAVTEQMDRTAFVLAGDLNAGQHLDPDPFPGLRRFGNPVEGVVVGQRDHVQAGLESLHHEHRGGVRAITDSRVGVQVDPHGPHAIGSSIEPLDYGPETTATLVPMQLNYKHEFNGSPDQVAALFRNEAFIDDVAKQDRKSTV